MASQTPSELAILNVRWRQQPSAALPQATSGAGAVAAATYTEVHEGATAAMASQTPSELAISSVRWRQQPSAALPKTTSGAGAVAAATYRELHEGATTAMASQTPSELAISSVRWRQQPSAAPRASKASGGTVCSLSSACLAPEPASAAAVQGRAGPAFYRHSPPGAQATTGAEAAVACREFDDARQPSFQCLRLEPVPGPDGATVEAPTPLDPNFEDLSRELSAPPAIWLWTCKD